MNIDLQKIKKLTEFLISYSSSKLYIFQKAQRECFHLNVAISY